MRLSAVKGCHQLSKLNQVYRRYSLGCTLLFLLLAFIWGSTLARMIKPQVNHQSIGSPLQYINNSVIDRILILLKPGSHIIGDSSSVVDDSKVSILISLGLRLSKWR